MALAQDESTNLMPLILSSVSLGLTTTASIQLTVLTVRSSNNSPKDKQAMVNLYISQQRHDLLEALTLNTGASLQELAMIILPDVAEHPAFFAAVAAKRRAFLELLKQDEQLEAASALFLACAKLDQQL